MEGNSHDKVKVAIRNLDFYYGSHRALKDISMSIQRN